MSAALDMLLVSPKQFKRTPQIGQPRPMPWGALAWLLLNPTIGNAKEETGAWSPALYAGNIRRKANLMHACALVVDIDGGADVRRVARVLARYRAIVHSTFSSTDAEPRCRVVLPFAEPVTARVYEHVHAIVRGHLRGHRFAVDDGAKDACRLSFLPVIREGARYRFRLVEGEPLDAHALIAAHPPEPKPRQSTSRTTGSGYARGALARAAHAIAGASEGNRHAMLCREAFSLARLELGEEVIAAALLPAFVQAAGDRRLREAKRTIADAIRARRAS